MNDPRDSFKELDLDFKFKRKPPDGLLNKEGVSICSINCSNSQQLKMRRS
jgi:hypothetical protein